MICKKCKINTPDAPYCSQCGTRQLPEPKKRTRRGNGTGSVFFVEGKGYVAVVTKYYYTDEKGKRKPKRISKTGFKTKRDAVNYLSTLSDKKEKGVSSLSDYWRVYESASLPKISKGKQENYYIAKRKLEDIFHIPIDTITIEGLQTIIDKKAKSYYPARDMKTVLSHLYKRAVAQSDISVNLATFIELPTLYEAEQIPFNKDEQSALWEMFAKGDDFVSYILLMIYTGMMPGELMKLQKSMIHLEKQQILGVGIKTKKRKEVPIILPDIIIPVIEKLLSSNVNEKILPISEKTFYKKYYECLERAGCRKLRPYSCRHTTGTALGTSDIPLPIVKEIMRHSKITSTQKYIHPDTKTMLESVNKVQI